MGGIIAGFLGGLGDGMAEAGKMMLADKLMKERDEASFLRDSVLRKDMQQQGFTHAETLATNRQTHTENLQTSKIGADDARSTKKIAADKASSDAMIKSRVDTANADREQTDWDNIKDRENKLEIANIKADSEGGSGATSQMKNYDHLRSLGVPPDDAMAISHNAYEKITDKDTGDTMLVNPGTREEIGRMTKVNGKNTWIPKGKQSANATVTSKHKRAAKAWASEQATWDNLDSTDFAEHPGATGKDKRANAIAAYAQQLANDERDNAPGLVDKDKPGIVNSAVPEPAVAEPDVNTDVKKVGGNDMTKENFISIMVKRYGEEKRADILKTWDSIQ